MPGSTDGSTIARFENLATGAMLRAEQPEPSAQPTHSAAIAAARKLRAIVTNCTHDERV